MTFFFFTVIKGFSQSKRAGTKPSDDKVLLPDTNLLAERKLFGNLKSIKSLKQSGISGAFTGQAVSKQAVLLKLILVKLGMTRSDTQDQYWSHIDMT